MRTILLMGLFLIPSLAVCAVPSTQIAQHGGPMALFEVMGAQPTPTGHTFKVRIISANHPLLDQNVVLQAGGPTAHVLQPGKHYLACVHRPGTDWLYRSLGTEPMEIARGDLGPAAAFIRNWVSADSVPRLETIEKWLVLLQQPYPLGQVLSQAALLLHRGTIGSAIDDGRLDELGAVLKVGPTKRSMRKMRIRLLSSLAPRRSARWFVAHFDELHPSAQMDILPLLARHPDRDTVDRLHQCAKAGQTVLNLRCSRLLTKIVDAKRKASRRPIPPVKPVAQ